jgi:hypothetical protein
LRIIVLKYVIFAEGKISYNMQNKISFKPRTCPNCNHRVGFKQYLKTLFVESTFHKWNCESCGISLQFSLWFKLILGVANGLWIYVVLQLRKLIDLNVFSTKDNKKLLIREVKIPYLHFFEK